MNQLKTWCLASLCLLAACKGDAPQGVADANIQKPAPSFDAIVAAEELIDRRVNAPGTVLPNESTELHPEASGRVVAINFKEGSFVRKGTLLVKLFDGDLQAQLRKLEVQLKVAEATERRQKELLAINGTSQQDYDLAGLNVSNIKADIELLRVNIAKTELRAPFDGRLGLRNISLGAYVTPATVVTSIAEVSRVKVEFAVPEKYAADMQPGKRVLLLATATGRRYSGTVIAAENSIAAASRNLMVRAAVSNTDASLTPGAFVEVTVEIGNKAPTIMIPSQALIPGTRNKHVIVANNGKAAFRIVTTGYRDSARIEITSGVKAGDTVITTGLLTIKEGMPIKPKLQSR